MANIVHAVLKAAQGVLKAIRRHKPQATGRVFKAMHCAEGMLVSALGGVSYAHKKRGPRKRRGKAESKVPKAGG